MTREELMQQNRQELIKTMKEAHVAGWYRIYNKRAMVDAILGTTNTKAFENKEWNMDDGIQVGMGATGWYWTDRYAYEVVRVISDKTVEIRRLNATLVGNWLDQDYTYEANEDAPVERVRKCKNGWKTSNGMRVAFGVASEYRDPSF